MLYIFSEHVRGEKLDEKEIVKRLSKDEAFVSWMKQQKRVFVREVPRGTSKMFYNVEYIVGKFLVFTHFEGKHENKTYITPRGALAYLSRKGLLIDYICLTPLGQVKP